MNSLPATTRCLLDKNIARYAIAGLRYGHLRPLSALETGVLSFWRATEERGVALLISRASLHVLQRLARYDEVRILLDAVRVLSPTPYHARWARRVRETTGLAREDAALIALTSFGSDLEGNILGAHLLITCDQPLVNGYLNHLSELQRRLRAMTAQLPAPFHQATLPRVMTPDEILLEWAG
jgi:hypothetical protein